MISQLSSSSSTIPTSMRKSTPPPPPPKTETKSKSQSKPTSKEEEKKPTEDLLVEATFTECDWGTALANLRKDIRKQHKLSTEQATAAAATPKSKPKAKAKTKPKAKSKTKGKETTTPADKSKQKKPSKEIDNKDTSSSNSNDSEGDDECRCGVDQRLLSQLKSVLHANQDLRDLCCGAADLVAERSLEWKTNSEIFDDLKTMLEFEPDPDKKTALKWSGLSTVLAVFMALTRSSPPGTVHWTAAPTTAATTTQADEEEKEDEDL